MTPPPATSRVLECGEVIYLFLEGMLTILADFVGLLDVIRMIIRSCCQAICFCGDWGGNLFVSGGDADDFGRFCRSFGCYTYDN